MSSHEFDDAFCTHNSAAIKCEHCGRTHFTHEAEDVNVLRAAAKTDPLIVEDVLDDSIGWGHLGGKQYAYQCPCRAADRYEEWVWEHKEEITDYLRARAKKEADEAHAILNRLSQ